MLAELGSVDAIVGIDNSDYVNDTTVLNRIRNQHLAELSKGSSADLEPTIALQPDLVLMFGMGNPERDMPSGFAESKLPVVIVLDHLEEHPLARAEWMKFFAAFVDKQQQADSIFASVETNYYQLKNKVAEVSSRPTVFSEIKFGEAWYMPGGKSFMALLIADAGGDYLWKDVNQSGSIPLTLEQVLMKAGAADVWLNQPLLFSLQDIAAADKRYTAFKAYQTKQVFNNTLGRNSKGYSPYWESGMSHPDRILADLIKIFHPNFQTNQKFYYYEQLPE
jgi:iron complex transport system substrate-binding protein